MYNEANTFEELKSIVIKDKDSSGMEASTRNRYPLRFVLLDNFRDCSLFVDFVQEEMGAMVQSVDKWIDPEYPDIMITHTELARRIIEHIKVSNGQDCVIAPFSELARFYDNDEKKTFDALLKTIKAIEAGVSAAEKHQRVYIPIVGLEGKMETFNNDSQSIIWRLRSDEKELTYRLVLTNGKTYGVKGLEKHYTIANTIFEWLNIWKDADKQVSPNIICTSKSIFANQIFAQPDNAFTFVPCDDAYEFLTKGLQLQFNGLSKIVGEEENWNELAESIDISNGFSFSRYVTDYFAVTEIENYDVFIKLWFDNPGGYERWLIAKYYQLKNAGDGFICRILSKTNTLTGNDFVEQMVLDMTEIESEMSIRQYCLREAAKRNVVLREAVETTLNKRLQAIADKYNAASALKYCTGITIKEKELTIAWLGKGLISIDQIKSFYPDLYHYYSVPVGVSLNIPEWLTRYMSEYKKAKIANVYTAQIESSIKTINSSEVIFDGWYQNFKTTRTILKGRGDIEVFYWIDGLGIEWIPLVKEIIREKNNQHIFLNDIKIARALLPSKTDINKADLHKLLPKNNQMMKEGDLDNLAHQSSNLWPNTIIKEIKMVRDIIEDIILKYNGKKVAIVSDHGLTYLSQLCNGIGLSGVESDHHGRVAVKNEGNWTMDNNYFRLEDGKTVCALRHQSLCNKVPKGQGSHGGCTPEEVLVPIFIISSSVDNVQWTADILNLELTGANPKVQFKIKNIPAIEIPSIEYDGIRYALHQKGNDIFESDPIAVNEQCSVVSLVIGDVIRTYNINVITGAKEDDLFSDF